MPNLHARICAVPLDADRAHDAMRAVINLHQPVPPRSPMDMNAITDPSCAGCSTAVTYTPIGKCRTLLAVAQVLRIEDEEASRG